jgi:hypothetical protein
VDQSLSLEGLDLREVYLTKGCVCPSYPSTRTRAVGRSEIPNSRTGQSSRRYIVGVVVQTDICQNLILS